METHAKQEFQGDIGRGIIIYALIITMGVFSFSSMAAEPRGDYGDAPDSANSGFPTKFATTNSRLGGPGAHHLKTGLEMLGIAVSSEVGAEDPCDPDLVQNLVDNDGHDDGVLFLYTYNMGSPFGEPLTKVWGVFRVTISASAPAGTRYLNVLFDCNRDQEWRNTEGMAEWLVVNQELNIAPGRTETFAVELGDVPTSALEPGPHAWLRATLTREQIDEVGDAVEQGGWDGSGQFEFGETEDYDSLIRLPVPDVAVKAKCKDCPLFMSHREIKDVVVELTLSGSDAPGCIVRGGRRIIKPGPGAFMGALIGKTYHRAEPGVVGQVRVGQVGPNKWELSVEIDPITHPSPPAPAPTQSLSIKIPYRIQDAQGTLIVSGTKTCDVIIFHGYGPRGRRHRGGNRDFGGATNLPQKEWIAVDPCVAEPCEPDQPWDPNDPWFPDDPCASLAWVMFDSNQPTPGTVTVVRVSNVMPSDFQQPGVLDASWIVGVGFDTEANLASHDPCEPLIETVISGLAFPYTDEMVSQAGISYESQLRPYKIPVYRDGFSNMFNEITTDVGDSVNIDDANNIVMIINPSGFSVWGIGQNEYRPGCFAQNPVPADGESVGGDLNELSWTAGVLADLSQGQDVWYSNDRTLVQECNESVRISASDCNCSLPSAVELETTYYWRVKDYNSPSAWLGPIWSFRAEYNIVDDFESYADTNELLGAWGEADGASLRLEKDTVHGGDSSMAIEFNNSYSPYCSEAYRSYSGSRDWTEDGVEALSIWFTGEPNLNKLYLRVEDTSLSSWKVNYEGGDMTDNGWHEWNIALQKFEDHGVDLRYISEFKIGIGDGTPDGSGTVHIDNIRLYVPRCLDRPVGDLNDDCVVDIDELSRFADEWLWESTMESDHDGDYTVDLEDFAHMAQDWLDNRMFP